jgi:long-chain acyl-CoA synthetase
VVVFSTSHEWLDNIGTVGRSVPAADVKIIADGREQPAVGIGEVYIKNRDLPDFTYRGLDDRRREIGRDGLISVGDVGYVNERGFLFLCDRSRDMVISGGVNIYPAEIGAVLHGMPGVQDCAVFGVPDDEYGESLAAVVEPVPARR